MSAWNVRRDHLKLIATSYLSTSLRSGAGVIFLVLSMIVGLVLAGIAVLPIDQLEAMSGGRHKEAAIAFNEAVEKFGPSVLRAFTDATPAQADFLLVDKPALISLFLIMMLAFIPFLGSLAGFNQTSGDIGSKGLRYLLPRTERANIFFGRLIATYLFALAVMTIIVLAVGLYTVVKVRFYPTGDVLFWLARGWLMFAIFLLPWITLSAWISCTIEIPFLSLLVCELGLLVWVIVVLVMTGRLEEAKYAAYATPWGWKLWLLDPSPVKTLGGIAAMLGFSGLFAWLGARTFDRRDL
jgi:hypothetical protein